MKDKIEKTEDSGPIWVIASIIGVCLVIIIGTVAIGRFMCGHGADPMPGHDHPGIPTNEK